MYKIRVIPRAQKDLDRLKGKSFEIVKQAILALSKEPRPMGVLKLTGEEGYRIRVGNRRIIYRINDEVKEVIIYRVKHRREAYGGRN